MCKSIQSIQGFSGITPRRLLSSFQVQGSPALVHSICLVSVSIRGTAHKITIRIYPSYLQRISDIESVPHNMEEGHWWECCSSLLGCSRWCFHSLLYLLHTASVSGIQKYLTQRGCSPGHARGPKTLLSGIHRFLGVFSMRCTELVFNPPYLQRKCSPMVPTRYMKR